jgi:hypothetical protein
MKHMIITLISSFRSQQQFTVPGAGASTTESSNHALSPSYDAVHITGTTVVSLQSLFWFTIPQLLKECASGDVYRDHWMLFVTHELL